MATGSSQVLARALPASLERLALLLVEAGHFPDHAVAMAANLLPGGAQVPRESRKAVGRWRHLRATPHEREGLAYALLARRVLAEGVLLSLDGEDVRDGTILSAHALCEARQARKPIGLSIGGSRASLEQIRSARTRLLREVTDLDELVEAVLGDGDELSRDDKSAKANPRVVHLQNRLNSLGYRVQPDGIFGAITEESVKDLQAKADLDTHGKVDSATRDALRNGGKPSWSINAPPGAVPSTAPPELRPAAADEPDVNKETGNSAAQTSPQGVQPAEKDSDGGKRSTTKANGKSVRVSVALKEATMERLQARLEEARVQRVRAQEKGDGMGVRVAQARMRVFERHLAELEERDFSQGRREALAKKGHALKEGGKVVFPIENASDLSNAAGLWKSGHHQTPAAKSHIQRQAKRLGAPDPFADVQEADAKADYPEGQMPSKCPICGARVSKKGVCQRGHSVKGLMEATMQQLDKEGLLG